MPRKSRRGLLRTLFYWTEPHDTLGLCVVPPIDTQQDQNSWKSWLGSLEGESFQHCPSTKLQTPEYWMLHPSLFQNLSFLCIKTEWMMERRKPFGQRRRQAQQGHHEQEAHAARPPRPIPFHLLFITPDAPEFVASAAFHALAKRYHPDQYEGKEEQHEMGEKMKEITNAKAEIWRSKGW